MGKKTFITAEKECEETFLDNGPWWHLYTPGKSTPMFLCTDEDYCFTMNLMARCAFESRTLKIVAFELMSNHIHMIISGELPMIEILFTDFRKRMKRYFTRKGLKLPYMFQMQTKAIADLNALRNNIVYTNRNGYVVNPDHTPFSYPWGTGRYYFNHFPISDTLGGLNYNTKRMMFRSRIPEVPEECLVIDRYIAPVSYCALELGMAMFRDAHQYFAMVSKNVESYSSLAAELHDKEFLTDAEMFAVTGKIMRDMYGLASAKELDKSQKLDLARKLHYEYHSSNGQIRRIIGLNQYEVDSLFPLSQKP
ncbi:MAG: hypothetical protein NC335_11040 [Bacteroides sp.]|nr:hypothetical protein [Bacteroides sp.]